jgi:hypothetical protein
MDLNYRDRVQWEKTGPARNAARALKRRKIAAAESKVLKKSLAVQKNHDPVNIIRQVEAPIIDATRISGSWPCPECTVVNPPWHPTCSVCCVKTQRACVVEKVRLSRRDTDESGFSSESESESERNVERDPIYEPPGVKKTTRNKQKVATEKSPSKRKNVAELNGTFWDRPEFNEGDLLEGSLLLFTPLESARAGAIVQNLVLSDSKSRETYLEPISIAIERNNQGQVYAARSLHKTAHGAKPREGILALERQGFQFDELGNNANHFYSKREPRRPVVLNDHPRVSTFTKLLDKLVLEHLCGIMRFVKKDKERGLIVLNVGLTSVQNRWKTLDGVRIPGTMTAMDTMPRELKRALGEAAIELCSIVRDEGRLAEDTPFFPACAHRRRLLDYFATELGLSEEMRPKLQSEGIALIFGNGTRWHFDNMNDDRDGHEWVLVGTAILNLHGRISEELADQLKAQGLDCQALPVMIIAYTRQVVGRKAEQLRHGWQEGGQASQCFLRDMRLREWRDIGLLCVDPDELLSPLPKDGRHHVDGHISPQAFVRELYERSSTDHVEPLYRVTLRPESVSKLFFYSSFVDGAFRLLFYISRELKTTVKETNLIELVAFAVREANGQLLFHSIVDSFSAGTFLGVAGAFREAFRDHKCLYVLCSMQAVYLRRCTDPEKEKEQGAVWVSSKQPRFQSSTPLLWQKKGDEEEVRTFITYVQTQIRSLRQGVERYKETGRRVYSTVSGTTGYGLGHLSSMHLMHLCALTSLIQPCYFSLAFVSENKKLGPARFFEKMNVGLDRDTSTIAEQFQVFCDEVILQRNAGCITVMPVYLENYACGRGRPNRKNDCLFFRDGRLQTVVSVSLHATHDKHDLMLLVRGNWEPMSDYVVPVYASADGSLSMKCDNPWPFGFERQDDVPAPPIFDASTIPTNKY